MKTNKIKLFAVLISIVYLGAICFFTVSIFRDISNGKERAYSLFNDIVEQTSSYINYYGLNSDFTDKYINYVQSNSDISAIVISQNSKSCFAYPVSSPLIKVNSSGVPVIKGDSIIMSIFSSDVIVDKYTGVNLTTAVYLVKPEQIFKYGKITFLIILVATVMVFGMLVYLYSHKGNSGFEEKENTNIFDIEDESFPIEETMDIHSQVDKPIDVDEPTDKTIEDEFDEQNVFNDEIVLGDMENDSLDDKDLNDDFNNKSALGSNISDPQGLFSNKTGLGWESYFETRLDSELVRAASSEQDLALFYIKITNLSFNNRAISQITDVLLEHFRFRDLIFEHGTDGFAAIVQGITLEKTMMLSQSLYTGLTSVLINNNMENKIGIGITTRSVRLVTGSRLMEEAQQALEKAFEEQGLPIVAFRVNPEKYRQCIVEGEE